MNLFKAKNIIIVSLCVAATVFINPTPKPNLNLSLTNYHSETALNTAPRNYRLRF